MQVVHRLYHGRVRRAPPWDCGFPLQTPRMQDTAEGFGQPIRQVFEPFFRIGAPSAVAVRREAALRGQGRRSLLALAVPADRAGAERPRALRRARIQQGRISDLPHLQLLHAARAAVLRPMSADRETVIAALAAAAARHRAGCSRRCSSAGSISAARGCRTSARRRCCCRTARSASCS